MSYQYARSSTITIAANTSSWGNLPVTGGSLVSVGLQNFRYLDKVYPTQLFIANGTSIFFQVDNRNSKPVEIALWAVVDGTTTPTIGAITGGNTKPIS